MDMPLADRTGVPVLAVLPFAAAGGGPGLAGLVEGLHEDVCGALSRFRTLRVIAPRSAAVVAGLDDAEIARRVGASHVLRGRLRAGGNRARLTADLSRCADASQLWQETIDVARAGFPALLDEVVGRIAATLNARLESAALEAARRRPTERLDVYELTLRGLAELRRGTLEADEAARGLFEQALALDPHHARAHAGLALSWFNEWSCQFWDRFEEARGKAYFHARRALELDERDGMVNLIIAKDRIYRGSHEQAAWYLDRALELSPSDADLLVQAAILEVYLGRPDAALANLERAFRLDPYHPNGHHAVAAFVHLFAGDLEGALTHRARSDEMPFVDAAAYTAIAYALAGEDAAAREELARFHAEYRARIAFGAPVGRGEALAWVLAVNPFRRPEDVALIRDGFARLEESPGAPPGPAPAAAAALLRDGAGWTVEFDGRRASLPDLKGLHDIRSLLARPNEEVHCLDLADRQDEGRGDAMLDERARRALKARIRELQEDLAEAEDRNDIGRAERLRGELDRLVEALSAALGLGGRSRRLGDLAERARSSVTWRIRFAMRKAAAEHPAFARHLESSLRTGAFCAYRPERPVSWAFGDGGTAYG
jgi:TolB-like protein